MTSKAITFVAGESDVTPLCAQVGSNETNLTDGRTGNQQTAEYASHPAFTDADVVLHARVLQEFCRVLRSRR